MDKAWKQLEANWKQIVLAVTAIILIAVIGFAFAKYKEGRDLKAELEYAVIMEGKDDAARVSKMEAFAEQYRGEDASYIAYMGLGSYYHRNREFDKAVTDYNKVIDGTKGTPLYFLAVDALFPVYIDMGKPESAAEMCLNAASVDRDSYSYSYKFKAANAFEFSGDTQKASEIYKELIADEKTPTSTRAKAEEQLIWLAASKK